MVNRLDRLFQEFNNHKLNYCVIRKYKFLPEKIIGDVDIAVKKEDLNSALKIVEDNGFFFYPYTEPHFFYFGYDKTVGLINLDIIKVKKLPRIKKFKKFYIFDGKGEEFRIRKSFLLKVKTNLQRKFHYLFKGKLVCFIGPDGSGKSTLSNKVYDGLSKFPLKKEQIYFGSRKYGRIYRIFDLILKIFKTYINKTSGKITLTDRYIYLTFRKNKFLRNLVKVLAPTPDIIFVMKTTPEIILKRKKELTKNQIIELYSLFEDIKNKKDIDSNKKIEDNSEKMINLILKKVLE